MREVPHNRWEHGSEFHWFPYAYEEVQDMPWANNGIYYGSGRDAFRSLLLQGLDTRGWKRLWAPGYFCQEVVESFLSTGIDVAVYPDGPMDATLRGEAIDIRPGDVLLVVNFFGLRTEQAIANIDTTGIDIIEDHSHDPWSTWARRSKADWCIASLRKTLPIPDGGVLWSPAAHRMPPEMPVSNEHRLASLEKFAAMLLKSVYLEGYPVEKGMLRRLALSGDSHIGFGKEISGMPEWTKTLLRSFPSKKWREQRYRNYQVLVKSLDGIPWLDTLPVPTDSDACPYSGILIFDLPERRTYIRQRLIDSNIYPSILWSLDKPSVKGIQRGYIELSRRILSISCDMRWTEQEMEYVASYVHKFGESFRGLIA